MSEENHEQWLKSGSPDGSRLRARRHLLGAWHSKVPRVPSPSKKHWCQSCHQPENQLFVRVAAVEVAAAVLEEQ